MQSPSAHMHDQELQHAAAGRAHGRIESPIGLAISFGTHRRQRTSGKVRQWTPGQASSVSPVEEEYQVGMLCGKWQRKGGEEEEDG